MNRLVLARSSRPFVARRAFHQTPSSLARILATDGVDDCCVTILRERGHQVDYKDTVPEAELCKIIGEYEGLIVRSATKVTPKVLEHATKLKIVGRAGVGVDNINVKEATKHGVMVMNTPGGNTVSTAQLTMSLLASLARHVPAADASIKHGNWDRKSFTGIELSGKTLGVIGCGRIGQVVAQSATGMGMTVLGYDSFMSADALKEAGIKRAGLEEIWKHADFITVHTPLTPETSNLLNDETIAKCKKGVRIINCARGGIVDEAALLRGLQSGHVGGAALDVFTSEPPKEHLGPLIQHPKLVCTPHLGASTEEAQVNVARDIANQMSDVFDEKDFLGVVNVNYLLASTQPHVKPFMQLAETLGAMQAQLSQSKMVKVTLRTYGGRDVDITAKATRQLLEAQVLKGLVKFAVSGAQGADLISSPAIARENGIQSVVSEDSPASLGTPYWNLVTVEAEREDHSKTTLTGAVFGNVPHVVKIDEYNDLFAFKPEGNYILSFRNEDRPGAISEVLDVLQKANVNIASMNVASPVKTESLARCFIALDDNVNETALATLRALPFLRDVVKIQLQ